MGVQRKDKEFAAHRLVNLKGPTITWSRVIRSNLASNPLSQSFLMRAFQQNPIPSGKLFLVLLSFPSQEHTPLSFQTEALDP